LAQGELKKALLDELRLAVGGGAAGGQQGMMGRDSSSSSSSSRSSLEAAEARLR